MMTYLWHGMEEKWGLEMLSCAELLDIADMLSATGLLFLLIHLPGDDAVTNAHLQYNAERSPQEINLVALLISTPSDASMQAAFFACSWNSASQDVHCPVSTDEVDVSNCLGLREKLGRGLTVTDVLVNDGANKDQVYLELSWAAVYPGYRHVQHVALVLLKLCIERKLRHSDDAFHWTHSALVPVLFKLCVERKLRHSDDAFHWTHSALVPVLFKLCVERKLRHSDDAFHWTKSKLRSRTAAALIFHPADIRLLGDDGSNKDVRDQKAR
ncbi:uncharacterized protein MYCFIDRAFT_175032 [Pseudocercospora fijiensis CIRAD86]|uniref:Uncharacterized protein n=1 Tax=Pseudocercospora fijiensis (strain CIRAD86) TaxID=383855 RepID=M3B2H8_PSEFD|nr:uncharacterized protein MYCFIDRAFT_175032 [Pseudocercospora fijiensis CIRAD86]EME83607.1 hypothetical protein MYCFIDRAFT_175032 [Pseudocercospora fijiensis CIRAD86]